MKGLLYILLFCFASPLFSFGGGVNPDDKNFPADEPTVTSTENHTNYSGIFEEEEFYKLGHEEKKHLKTESSTVDTSSLLKRVTSVSIRETFEKSQDRSYLYKIGVLRL